MDSSAVLSGIVTSEGVKGIEENDYICNSRCTSTIMKRLKVHTYLSIVLMKNVINCGHVIITIFDGLAKSVHYLQCNER